MPDNLKNTEQIEKQQLLAKELILSAEQSLASLHSSLLFLSLTLDRSAKGVAFHLPLARDSEEAGMYKTVAERRSERAALGKSWELPIPVRVLSSAQCVPRCKAAFNKIIRRIDQPPDRPDRLAGLLWDLDGPVRSAAHQVNHLKSEFEKAMRAIHRNPKVRRMLVQGTSLQKVMLLQAYREIEIVEEEVEEASFGWSGGSHVVERWDIGKAVAYVEDLFVENEHERDGWRSILLASGEDAVAKVRRMAPFPYVSLKVNGSYHATAEDGSRKQSRRVPANMPLLLMGNSSSPEIRRPLGDYEPGREKPREKSRVGEVLIEQLGFHRYRW